MGPDCSIGLLFGAIMDGRAGRRLAERPVPPGGPPQGRLSPTSPLPPRPRHPFEAPARLPNGATRSYGLRRFFPGVFSTRGAQPEEKAAPSSCHGNRAAWLGWAAMEPPPPSEWAAAALENLRGVEKQLQNEGLVFNKETVFRLQDAIRAIKELEEERKHTIELWEEETIKNCSLRVHVKGFPAIIMKEFEELVAAARRSRFSKLKEMEDSIHATASTIELTYGKQELSEALNRALCEEQKQLLLQHTAAVEQLNQQMATKHTINLEINELHNLRREDEEETVRQKSAIQELKEIMASEADDFEEKMRWLESQRISTQREDLAQIFKKIKQLIKEYEFKKAEKEDLLKKRTELQTEQKAQDSTYDDGRGELLRQLQEIDEELEAALRANRKLKGENDLLSTQFRTLTDEEERSLAERDRLAEEFERLSNLLTEKLDKVAKCLMETRVMEEELQKLQDIFQNTQDSYAREIGSLEVNLRRESERRTELQDQLAEITAEYQKMQADHDEIVNTAKQKLDQGRSQLDDLMKQNEDLKKEIMKSLETIKQLTEKLQRRRAFYKKRNAAMEAEIERLQEEYNTTAKLLQEKEDQLKVKLPLSEELQKESEQANTNYTNQTDLFAELKEEERTLIKSIEKSQKEVNRLRRLKVQVKNDIMASRKVAFEQLQRFTHSVKFLEKDNYEVDRKLYILNAENDRLRAGIAFLKEDIATIDKEADLYQSKRQQTQKDLKTLHDLFIKRWLKDSFLHKRFLNYEQNILGMLTDLLIRNNKRIGTVDSVHTGLQLNCEAMEALLKSKSKESHSKE
ncbi:trichohyalin-like isoform X2 [Hemicordylus capensis]|uniref:trichohyalin-like isoform X2 n=1 Tax=Hemicordylus capensis TaxID=884348 RepID=UPI0023025A29|nr:trichohyalin-like isoform X2 [Hemicordylus capensis]